MCTHFSLMLLPNKEVLVRKLEKYGKRIQFGARLNKYLANRNS